MHDMNHHRLDRQPIDPKTDPKILCQECEGYLANDIQIGENQGKIKWVVLINAIMMIVEVIMGYTSGSMALVAEGWHMGSHVVALTITLLVYRLAKSPRVNQHLSFGAGKFIPLGGYSSALVLSVIAILVAIESAERLFSPVKIEFTEALIVAGIGLTVNIVSALILNVNHTHSHSHNHDEHHEDPVHDHNIRSAFIHVVTDALTSVLAILALTFGRFYHWNTLDPVIGIVGAVVIFVWAFQLCRDTGWELLDGHSKTIDWKKLRSLVETNETKILDFHVWRIAPKAVACELVVNTKQPRGLEHYRELLRHHFAVQHIVVEERTIQ